MLAVRPGVGCTYKNKEVNTYLLRGRPISFFASSGASCPRPGDAVRSSDSEELLLCNLQEFKESDPSASGPWPFVARWGRFGSPGETESGSAGVQPDEEYPGRRCAEGASPGRSLGQGFFLAHPTKAYLVLWIA